MKRTFLFSFLITCCISCFSCDKAKDDKQKYKQSITGDWDWVNSESGSNGGTSAALITYSPSTTNTNYGFRIKKNNTVFLYKNGEQIKKGKLKGIEDKSNLESGGGKITTKYYSEITFNFDGENVVFIGNSTLLTCTTWPYNGYSNHFKKI